MNMELELKVTNGQIYEANGVSLGGPNPWHHFIDHQSKGPANGYL